MSRAADSDAIIGINWSSTRFRAYLIAANGALVDAYTEPSGVAGLAREQMIEIVAALVQRWPGTRHIYASGMIGSAMGWTDVGYAEAPAAAAGIARLARSTTIGDVPLIIVPGVACRRTADGAPDVMRGEEIEILGTASSRDGMIALPGLHTKWVKIRNNEITEFATSMVGEIFDRLTEKGLLASIVEGAGEPGAAFRAGIEKGRAGTLGLGALLFGARARVVRGDMEKGDAASYVRGLLIGADLVDATTLFGDLATAPVTLIGEEYACRLYAAALDSIGIANRTVEPREACVRGFLALHEAVNG
jgi:2-dehydro-3-deoxygalactonokinase